MIYQEPDAARRRSFASLKYGSFAVLAVLAVVTAVACVLAVVTGP